MTIPTNRDELREFLAKKLGGGPAYREAADYILSALDAAGLVIVPREATNAMVLAGGASLQEFADLTMIAAQGAWPAMLSASPYEKDRER